MNNLIKLTIVVSLAAFLGCEPNATPEAKNESGTHTHADGTTHANHGHTHDAPHDGTVADWGGGKYHVEFLVDHEKQEATVYVLGADCKTAAPIASEKINLAITEPAFQVELMAQPENGEPEGTSSKFVGKHESLGVVREFEGKIFGSIDGKPYSGDFKEVAHDH